MKTLNYNERITIASILLIDALRGKVSHVNVRHDDNCGKLKAADCDCNPDIEICTPAYSYTVDAFGIPAKLADRANRGKIQGSGDAR